MRQVYESIRVSIESELSNWIPRCGFNGGEQLDSALHYAVFPGGKRLRPTLTVLGARILSQDIENALAAACAIEFVHTSSLILDDLPCMDDASLRRGNPALHCVYGEDVALLVGIALLNQAYAIFGRVPLLIQEATECIGVEGMIGGQALDLTPQDLQDGCLEDRNRKTSAMMRLALTAGALACGASSSDVAPLATAGNLLGQAYQIGDDLLDLQHSGVHGKTSGQDARHKRPTHAVTLDAAGCMQQIGALVKQATSEITNAYGADRASELIEFIAGIFESLARAGRGK